MKYEVATCFNSFNVNFLFNNLVQPLTWRQNDNLAPKLEKVAHACYLQEYVGPVKTRSSSHVRLMVSQSVIMPRCRVHSGNCDQILLSV
jgi:hypothetical protein